MNKEKTMENREKLIDRKQNWYNGREITSTLLFSSEWSHYVLRIYIDGQLEPNLTDYYSTIEAGHTALKTTNLLIDVLNAKG